MKVYVLYYDYNSDEGCGAPEGVVFSETEADDWSNKDDHEHYAVAEFEVEGLRLESAVVEAAVKYRNAEKFMAAPTDGLFAAVDALIAARSETKSRWILEERVEAEAKGNSQDDLISDVRERVPREE